MLTAGGTEAFAPLSAIDYDLTRGQPTPLLSIGSVIAPQISPDGRFVGGYESLTQIDGIQQGALLVVDLRHRAALPAEHSRDGLELPVGCAVNNNLTFNPSPPGLRFRRVISSPESFGFLSIR